MRCLLAIGLTLIGIILNVTFADDVVDEVIVSDDNTNTKSEAINEALINYQSPIAESGKYYFTEHFDDLEQFDKKWIKSSARKDDTDDDIAKYDGVWSVEAPQRQILRNDLGLVLKSKAKHAAIAARLNKPFVFADKPLIIQYEVQLQDGQECGGAYIKLLSTSKDTSDLKQFNDKTPYSIMFGPDKCGMDHKLHFIFRHVNPRNGSIEEKHCRKSKERLDDLFKDKQPHLYQLLLNPDNTYVISVDRNIINEGTLLNDFTPPVNPPKEIDDPNHHKPSDWDEREKIPDPDAKKPDDWDEDAPAQIPDASTSKPDEWLDDEEIMIPDPTAIKPDDWDTDMDGDWEAPLITNPKCEKIGCGKWEAPLVPNPNYRGKWRAPLIDNPNYQGKWSPRKIPNPDFYEDLNPFKMPTIAAIGIELWSMSNEILFDNILITDDLNLASNWAEQTFDLKHKVYELDAESFLTKVIKFTNENPYMWAVYLIVIGLPITFVVYFCCSSDKKDTSAKSKKTDEPQPDDDLPATKQNAMPKNKSDLDKPIDGDDNNDDDGDGGDDNDDNDDGVDNDEQEQEQKRPKNKSDLDRSTADPIKTSQKTDSPHSKSGSNNDDDDNDDDEDDDDNEDDVAAGAAAVENATNEEPPASNLYEERKSENVAEGTRKRKPRKD